MLTNLPSSCLFCWRTTLKLVLVMEKTSTSSRTASRCTDLLRYCTHMLYVSIRFPSAWIPLFRFQLGPVFFFFPQVITVLVKSVTKTSISDTQLQVLLGYAEEDIYDNSRQATAFGLLKVYLGLRPKILYSVYDLILYTYCSRWTHQWRDRPCWEIKNSCWSFKTYEQKYIFSLSLSFQPFSIVVNYYYLWNHTLNHTSIVRLGLARNSCLRQHEERNLSATKTQTLTLRL